MKILYFFEFAPDPQRGGASRLTQSLVNYWKENHKDLDFFCAYLKKEKDYTSFFKDEILLSLKDKESFSQFLYKNEISLIIYQTAFSRDYFEYVLACSKNNIPIITVYHSMPGWELQHTKNILKRIPWKHATIHELIKKTFLPLYLKHVRNLIGIKNRSIYEESSKYIVLSKQYIPLFKKSNQLTDDTKLLAISNPLSYPIQNNINFQEKKNQALIVGRFSECEKRLLLALQCWKEFNKLTSKDQWELIIVGFGKDEEIYKKYVTENKLDNVIFVGKQNPLEYYKKASIFLMTSAFEGFPLTLTEAQQFGVVPIVMDSFPALHDIIINDYNGIIVANNNVKAMTSALIQLSKDKGKREVLAKNGLNYINQFSVTAIAKQWENLFNYFK